MKNIIKNIEDYNELVTRCNLAENAQQKASYSLEASKIHHGIADTMMMLVESYLDRDDELYQDYRQRATNMIVLVTAFNGEWYVISVDKLRGELYVDAKLANYARLEICLNYEGLSVTGLWNGGYIEDNGELGCDGSELTLATTNPTLAKLARMFETEVSNEITGSLHMKWNEQFVNVKI